MKKIYPSLLLGLWILFVFSCDKNDAQTKTNSPKQNTKAAQNDSVKIDSTKQDTTKTKTPQVTFIELGSVNCIPCKAMQPIMKAVEEDYGDQIEIVFYDVRQDPAPARQYRIRLIPTQVFLDESGNEFFRHEGILPKENIDSLLVKQGLKIKTKTEPKKI
jgi:thioredoxin 1